MTCTLTEVNRIYYNARVTGREPFFVPSQPGIATEKRPAVPPATTTWISSVDGNLDIMASGSRRVSLLLKRKFVPSPWSASGKSVR